MRNILVFVILLIALTGCAQQSNSISCGIDDIDQIRKEVKIQATTADNANPRKAILYRWWRLLWHQGYDMEEFDELADMLLNLPDSDLNGLEAITAGYMKLEEIMSSGKMIPEVRGERSNVISSSTDWPLYHGSDATQSGFSPDEGPSTGNIVWKFPKSYGCNISPEIDAGKVYIPGFGALTKAFGFPTKGGTITTISVSLFEIISNSI